MKKISKSSEPFSFACWKAKANENWQPSYETLQNPEKKDLHLSLLHEQKSVCCYCGRKISVFDSHIEHFRPQEKYFDLALDYRNLHASCIRETKPGTPLHCGHAKGSEFDERKCISPLEEYCEERFIYSIQNGAIYAADRSDESATYMIDLLKIDLPFLNIRRAEVLKNVFDDEFLNSATVEEIEKIVCSFETQNSEGILENFSHVVSRYGRQLIKAFKNSSNQ